VPYRGTQNGKIAKEGRRRDEKVKGGLKCPLKVFRLNSN